MSDLISRNELFKKLFTTSNGRICPDTNIDNFPLTLNVKDVKNAIRKAPTAFDLENVIMELERISKDMQSEANDLASIGDYGCATKFEGMAQAYKDCVKILKSVANATNGKNGG